MLNNTLLFHTEAMPAASASPDDAESFEISLGGEVVHCTSLADAVAVKAAEDILTGCDPTAYRAEILQRIAIVLRRYDRLDAAQKIAGPSRTKRPN